MREETTMQTKTDPGAGVDGQPAERQGVPTTSVRVLYPDLHGVARGKDVPIAEFDHAMEKGLCFCSAVMGTDLRHTPVKGGEEGYPDLVARPDVATMAPLPWEPGVTVCLADLSPAEGGHAIPDPRGAVRAGVDALRALDLDPIVGPELEFFLVRRDPSAPNGIARRVDNLSMVYTVGPQADPDGVVRGMTEHLAQIGLEVFAVNHEFMNSQYEINLRHADAVTAADRAFLLKACIKDIAAQNGLVATFMGKPFNDQGGSGTHLHLSLNRDGRNAFDAAQGRDGVSDELRWFIGGLLAHATALMAFLNPTVNAYRRIQPDSLAPTHANWGWDNRSTFVRVPPERGGRHPGRDPRRRRRREPVPGHRRGPRRGRGRDPPPARRARAGRRRRLPGRPRVGRRQPPHLARRRPRRARGGRGAQRCGRPRDRRTFLAVKRFELERHRAWVSDWDVAEYLHHL
jgi:glutamine synthetase